MYTRNSDRKTSGPENTPATLAGNNHAAPLQDNRERSAIQRKQLKGMIHKPAFSPLQLQSNTHAPIQLAKWKFQKAGGWVLISGGNSNIRLPFPKNPLEGDIFDDQTGMVIHASASPQQSVTTTRTVPSGMPVSSPLIPGSSTPKVREVHKQQKQKMSGGPTPYYNTEHNVDSRFAVSVDTSAKTCDVIIRIRSTADKSVFSNWASVTDAKWSNRFGLRVFSQDAGLSGFYMIRVKLVQVPDHQNPHHVVAPQDSRTTFADLRGVKGTKSMTEWGTQDAVDVPHEVGHMLGNLDEYYTINGVEYTKPGESARGGVDIGGGSIMNDPKNNPLERHYELIRKEAATAIGVQDDEVGLEEAVSQVQAQKAKTVTRPGSAGGIGLSMSDLSGALGGLKKRTTSTVKPDPADDEPITDFRGVLRRTPAKETSPQPLVKTPQPGAILTSSPWGSMVKPPAKMPVMPQSVEMPLPLMETVKKTTTTPPFIPAPGKPTPLSHTPLRVSTLKNTPIKPPAIPVEQPVTDFRGLLKPVPKKTGISPEPREEEPMPQPVNTLPKPRRPLPELPQSTTVKTEKQEVVQEPVQEISIIDKRRQILKNGFTHLKELFDTKAGGEEYEHLLQEAVALKQAFGAEYGEQGAEVFFMPPHWTNVRQRILDLGRRVEALKNE